MLWLGVHFPELPLEVFDTGVAAPAAVPTVILEQGRVMLRDSAAIEAGIAPGTTLATAHGIAPGLAHHRRSPEREQRRLALLGEALYGFSARVCLREPLPGSVSAGVMLEIGASLKLFGDAERLARRVTALCRDMGHRVGVRCAVTPLAALILARADVSRFDRVPLQLAAVEPERLAEERIERLANMGIHTLQQLLALPAGGLARRFGEDLVDYLARITGDRPDPRPGIVPSEHFRATLHLLEPLGDKQSLGFPMQRLLGDLQHWLVARQLGTEQLRWSFASSAGQSACMPVRFARAQQSRAAFLDITRLQLDATTLPDEVIDLTLEARRLAPWAADSRSLFGDTGGPGAMEDAVALVDQLRARLGMQACYSLGAADQYTPECAWKRAAPADPVRPHRRAGGAVAHPPADAATAGTERPLWLFDPPQPVRRERFTLLRGPERLHTGWWMGSAAGGDRGAGHARDYYVARHRNGAQCWVFVDPWEHWFLHGYFS